MPWQRGRLLETLSNHINRDDVFLFQSSDADLGGDIASKISEGTRYQTVRVRNHDGLACITPNPYGWIQRDGSNEGDSRDGRKAVHYLTAGDLSSNVGAHGCKGGKLVRYDIDKKKFKILNQS